MPKNETVTDEAIIEEKDEITVVDDEIVAPNPEHEVMDFDPRTVTSEETERKNLSNDDDYFVDDDEDRKSVV